MGLSSTRLSFMASAAAWRRRSASSSLAASPFLAEPGASFSSSLSPRLKGSFSAMGLGSMVDSGCHLLGRAPPDGAAPSLGGSLGEGSYRSMSSTSSRKATLRSPAPGLGEADGGGGLKRLGLAGR